MRVLHVMESTIGGTRRHIVDVAREQRELSLDVQLCVSTLRDPRFPPDLARLEELGCGVHRLDMHRAIKPGQDGRHLLQLSALLRRLAPDVVHTHSSKAGVLGRAASIATDVGRRIHTPHTFAFLFEAMFGPLKRALFRQLEQHLSGHTHRVVAVSPSEGHTFHTSGVVDAARIRVAPNGIDPDPFLAACPIPRAELGVREGVPLFAVVGLLNAAKGQDLAIRALREPGAERAHLLIAGEGEDRPALETLVRELGLESRVTLLGWCDDVPALLATIDCLLLPSRWEGMPYVVLEAMASRCPVVASPVDGACDLVEEGLTGFLAESAHPRHLAAAIGRAAELSPEGRRAMGERARAVLYEHYTARKMARRLVEIYAS